MGAADRDCNCGTAETSEGATDDGDVSNELNASEIEVDSMASCTGTAASNDPKSSSTIDGAFAAVKVSDGPDSATASNGPKSSFAEIAAVDDDDDKGGSATLGIGANPLSDDCGAIGAATATGPSGASASNEPKSSSSDAAGNGSAWGAGAASNDPKPSSTAPSTIGFFATGATGCSTRSVLLLGATEGAAATSEAAASNEPKSSSSIVTAGNVSIIGVGPTAGSDIEALSKAAKSSEILAGSCVIDFPAGAGASKGPKSSSTTGALTGAAVTSAAGATIVGAAASNEPKSLSSISAGALLAPIASAVATTDANIVGAAASKEPKSSSASLSLSPGALVAPAVFTEATAILGDDAISRPENASSSDSDKGARVVIWGVAEGSARGGGETEVTAALCDGENTAAGGGLA
jgi:hypothetical protein